MKKKEIKEETGYGEKITIIDPKPIALVKKEIIIDPETGEIKKIIKVIKEF